MVVELFLSLALGIAFRRLSIVCSRFRGQGQISFQKVGAQEIQPNHTVTLGKRRCIRRLQCRNPSLQRWLFHEFPVSVGLQLVPKLYVRYVRRQLVALFENQGLLASFHQFFYGQGQILGFLPNGFPQNILGKAA